MAESRPTSIMVFTIVGSRIVAIDALADPARLARFELADRGGVIALARDRVV